MLPDACVGSLNNNETLEELKERLRKGVCHASYGCPLPVLGEKHALMNDLSQSLPNLVDSDPHMKHLSEGTPARNSCSDIFTKNNGISNGKVISGVCVKPCLETTVDGDTPQRRNTVTVSLSPDNNRLSAVLQNIPLLYIPETKQLISVGPTADNVDNRTSQVGNKTETTDAAIQGLITADDINNDLDQSRERHSSKADSEISNCSVTSSQPTSDTSTVSDRTVTHVCNYDAASSVIDGPSDTTLEDVSFSEDPCAVSDRAEVPLITHPDPAGSLGKTDASSFSSISSISTGTEFSISAASYSDDVSEFRVGAVVGDTDDSGFTEVNLQGGNTYERSRNSSQDSGFEEKQNAAAKTKRRGLTSFLARNLFSRKPKEAGASQASALGWKLFGRIPPKETPVVKEASVISEEYQAKLRTTVLQHPSKKADIEVSSTTALILENRPQGLPSKTPEEERKHRQEYEAMVEAAKRREVREAKLRKKQMRRQIQHEELLAASLQVWTKEILPNWEHMRHSKRTKELWWQGLPPSVRGRVWKLAIGNDLNLTDELYEICVSRAEDRLKLISEDSDSESSNEPESSKEASVELIKLDISRTFPQLCIFQKGGPYHDILHSLLGAYVCYRPDVGYVQGMSFIAAVFLLNMEAADAFRCFANLLNQPCQIAFFRLDESLMKSYFATYEEFLEENLPKLYSHFQKQSLTPDLYLIDWMFTLYSKSLPLDVASRVWDVFSRDGEEFLFRTALGILKLYEEDLLNLDFIHLAQFLTRLPESLPGDKLFRCIDRIHLLTYNRTFSQVLAGHKENKDVS